jgi:hypothetical protein
MRSGTVVAVVVAVFAVIGVAFWLSNQNRQVAIDAQRNQEITQDQAGAPVVDGAAPVTQDTAGGAVEDDVIVVGDEITDDTVVVQSETEGAVIVDAEGEAGATAPAASDGTTAGATTDPAATDTGATTATAPAAGTATGAATLPAEELLTPANFNAVQVMTLINTSDQLTEEERSSLGALVDGASANPEMVEPTVTAIRAALGLPPLN